MPWMRRKVSNLGRVTLDANYTAASGTMELTTGNSAFIPTTGTFWLAWSEDENDPDAVIHLFRVTAVSGDDVSVTAETSEGGGDTNITAGQVLRVVTTIGAIEMLGMVLLEEKTASASASLDFAACISSVYDEYMIDFVNVLPATDGTNLRMRMSTDGGSTYDSSALYGSACMVWRAGAVSQNGAESGATSIDLSGFNIENTVTQGGLSGSIKLFGPGNAASWKTILGQVAYVDNATFRLGINVRGHYESTTVVNAFQFFMASGNITSGTIRVYGISKT
jgi:hypothetical protein